MHRGHDHDHDHHHGNGAGAGHNHQHPPSPTAQWQRLHDDGAHEDGPAGEPDLDLVEAAFADSFATAADPTSFLRLAQIPFELRTADGARLCLLRVETEQVTDVGSVMPHFGSESFRYDPLPAKLTERRRRLRFVYTDGKAPRALSFAEVRALGG